MTYFQNCKSVNEVKSLYKELAKQHHPDKGGNTATMQAINSEYSFAIAKIAKGENLSSEETSSIIDQSEAYREAINKVIHLENITIEVVGSWVWITGNTYPVKDTIKEAGFFFASKKLAWYFRTDENKVKSFRKTTLDQNRAKYGSQVLTSGKNTSFKHLS